MASYVPGKLLDPQGFVRHLHTDRENRTCHWGFDPSHWRCYVHLDETVYSKSKKTDKTGSEPDPEPVRTGLSVLEAQNLLNEVKARFIQDPVKRKQVGSVL